MSQPSLPDSPDPAKTYEQGIQIYLRHLPELLNAEQGAREDFDPLRIFQQQQLQDVFGPNQARQQLDTLHQLDPESHAVRSRLGERVFNDLNAGHALPDDYRTELQREVRGAQSARGNTLGTGAAGAEATFMGKAAQDLYQQHLQNAGNFLSSPTPVGQIMQTSAVQPDRSSSYTNPNAGTLGVNLGQQSFQNQLALSQLASGQGGGWGGALGGAASGAATGSQVGGGWGALVGGVVGGAAGFYSSRKVKRNIVSRGTSSRGFPKVEFEYLDGPQRFRGTIAEEVQKILPEAVFEHNGVLAVRYDMIDVPHEEIA